MEIKFDSLKEIKDYILMTDIYQLCEFHKEWGGHGYIITNRDYNKEAEKYEYITEPKESKVLKSQGDKIVITPYYRQISWLFDTLYRFTMYNNELDPHSFLDGFCIICEGYFVINPEHSVKELMLFVIDGLKRMSDSKRATNKIKC